MYEEALMIPAMKIWELPDNKKEDLEIYCRSGNYMLEEKIDGAHYTYEKTKNYSYLFSRTKSVKNGLLVDKSANVPHIMNFLDERLPEGTILIGEIFYPGKTSKDVNTIMLCLADEAIKRQEKNEYISYYIHDIIRYDNINLMNAKAEIRYKILCKIWEKHSLDDCTYLRKTTVVNENLIETINEIFHRGGEGVVLKKKDAPYIPDKRPAWSTIKVKKHGDEDVICIGFCSATKYYSGKLDLLPNYCGKDAKEWPYWVIEDMNLATGEINYEEKVPIGETKILKCINCRTVPVTKGYYYNWKTSMEIGALDVQNEIKKIGTVSSGLTDAIKAEMTEHPEKYLNKVIKVGYMEKDNQEKTLRHPTFIELREDKIADECLLTEIFK